MSCRAYYRLRPRREEILGSGFNRGPSVSAPCNILSFNLYSDPARPQLMSSRDGIRTEVCLTLRSASLAAVLVCLLVTPIAVGPEV